MGLFPTELFKDMANRLEKKLDEIIAVLKEIRERTARA